MADALLNLVRCSTLADTEGLDVESGSTTYTQHDEVKLVQPDGSPAALPSAPSWISSDIRYEYTSGAIGQAARRRRLQIPIAVDYIGNDIHNKLQRWMHDRALLWFNPGFGRFTDFAYRPLIGAASDFADGTTTLTDLTGRWDIATQNNSLSNYVWDSDLRVMREWSLSNSRRVISTPFGATEVYEGAKTNRFTPGYPGGATEGNDASDSGWTKNGADSADITFSLVADAFGHDDMPDALRVQASFGVNKTRGVIAQSLWNSGDANYQGYAFTGTGTMTVSVWVKGRVGAGARLQIAGAGGTDTVALDELDLSEWTKVSLALASDWSVQIPYVWFDLGTDASGAESDFLIGPCTVLNNSSTQNHEPEWTPASTAVSASHDQVADYVWPRSGSVACSFYWPAGADFSKAYMMGASSAVGLLWVEPATIRFYAHQALYLSGTISPVEGAINTFCATWAAGTLTLYFNGQQIAIRNNQQYDLSDSTAALMLGNGGSGWGAWPLQPLSWRIDRDVWTASEVAYIDASLRDPVANALSVMARGRKFRIAQIPSTPRLQAGGTAWIGQLVLEEHEYDGNFADITSREVY